jgi:hypothetical protein
MFGGEQAVSVRSATGALAALLLTGVGARAQEVTSETTPPTSPPELAVEIPGSHLSAIVPEGFELADGYAGMTHDYVDTTLVVSEVPAPLETVEAWLDAGALEDRGLRRVHIEDFALEGAEGTLYHVLEDGDEQELYHWIVTFPADGPTPVTPMVVLTTPASLEPRLRDDALRLLASLRFDAERRVDPFAGLPFRIDVPPGLLLQAGVEDAVVLIRADQIGPLAPGDPRVIVSQHTLPNPVEDLGRHAREHLRSSDQITLFEPVREGPRRMGRLAGWEIVADGVAFERPVPVVAYQTLAVDPKNGYAVQGFAAREQQQTWLPRFRAVVQSFRRAR